MVPFEEGVHGGGGGAGKHSLKRVRDTSKESHRGGPQPGTLG